MRLTILLKFIAACLLISQTTYAESFLKELEKKREAEFKIHTSPNKGFSLIELMVVISIIALLTAISIPKIAYLNIRAARAELYVNMRGIFTHVQSFRAEHERYPSTIGVGGSFSMYSGDTLIDVYSHCPSYDPSYRLEGGFLLNNCENLRYVYRFLRPGDSATCPVDDGSECFVIDARAMHTVQTDGFKVSSGSRIPTTLCKKPAGYTLYFIDSWEILANGVMRPFGNNVVNDALQNCF